MTSPGFSSRHSQGFTLVEIVVVIAIMGLLLVMLIGISSAIVGNQRRADTRTKLANVETALALYVSRTRRLPCPANGASPPSDANYGREIRTIVASPTFTCLAGTQIGGVVPWNTLGLAESDVTDGWGTRLTYRVEPGLVQDGAMNMTWCDPAGAATALSTSDPTSGYCRIPTPVPVPFDAAQYTDPKRAVESRGLLVVNLQNAPIAVPADGTGAAYVLISHGENREGGYDNSSNRQGASGPISSTREGWNFADVSMAINGRWVDDFQVYTDVDHFDDFVIRPSILAVANKANLGPRAH